MPIEDTIKGAALVADQRDRRQKQEEYEANASVREAKRANALGREE